MSLRDRWGNTPRGWRAAGVGLGALLIVVAVGALVTRDDDTTVDASGEVTTEDTTTTSTEAEVTTTAPPTTSTSTTTTTVPPTTTTVPPTTSTSPPPTAPPTTMPAAPVEFAATVRGSDQGPDYYGILYGTTYGGSGGFNVFATCRPGTVTVTVLDDGMDEPLPPQQAPVRLYISVEDSTPVAEFVIAQDGQVFTHAVTSRVRVQVLYPSNHDVRIKYDCRG